MKRKLQKIKNGWIITADPYFIVYKKLRLVADLGAERPLSAQKGDTKIVIEVKSFLNPSFIYDLERAVGQYIIYRNFLKKTAPDYQIYLARSPVGWVETQNPTFIMFRF